MPSPTLFPAIPIPVTPQEAAIPAEIPTWVAIGPWVHITSLAIDPLTPSILYAGTDGGVFKSTDGGGSWSAINAGLVEYNGFQVWDLVIDPLTPSIIYAGMGGGVFKSTNAGESWSAAGNVLMVNNVSCLLIDPVSTSTLYAVTRNSGVFKSTNAGEDWSAANPNLSDQNPAIVLALDPTSPGTLYLGAYVGGVFKSTNAGGDWSAASTGLGATEDNPVDGLVIDPVTPTSTIYALTRYRGVFKSTNGAQDWRAFDTGLDLSVNGVHALLVDPLEPSTIYIGTSRGEVFKTTNDGRSWSAMNAGLSGDLVTVLAADPMTPAILYLGTYGGGIFTNQVERAFAPVPMPTLTPPPAAIEEAVAEVTAIPLPALPSSTPGPSSLPTLMPLETPFRASGTLDFRKPVQLPENARVIVIWSVISASPGYAYVFGEGTIALNDSSFEIVFDEPPPPQALNWSGTAALGVGIVIITTDQNLMSRSTLPETYSNAGVLGASGRYGLIYIQGSFEAFTEGGWWDRIRSGLQRRKGAGNTGW